MYYFAYGANMPKREIENRLGSVKDFSVGILDKYQIKFNKQSIDGSGKTNIVPSKNSNVIGVIYVLSKEQIEKMDGIEGGYKRIKLNVMSGDDLVNVEVYVAQQKRVNDALLPTREYLEKLINGAKEYKFPPSYIQNLQTTPTQKDSVIIEDASLVAVDVLVATIPPLAIAWALSKALLGASLKLRQKKALEWVEMVKNNPDIFIEQTLKNESFQDGFAIAIEQYIKERSLYKRKIIRKVFLGFASSKSFEEFNLERMLQIASNISLSSIEYLSFIETKIVPSMMVEIDVKVAKLSKKIQNKEWWSKNQKEHEPLSKFVNLWIDENFNPNSQKVKDKYHYNQKTDRYNISVEDIFDIEKTELNKMREAIGEFVSLGLFRVIVEGDGTIGGGGANIAHTLTASGWEFIEYIKNND